VTAAKKGDLSLRDVIASLFLFSVDDRPPRGISFKYSSLESGKLSLGSLLPCMHFLYISNLQCVVEFVHCTGHMR